MVLQLVSLWHVAVLVYYAKTDAKNSIETSEDDEKPITNRSE